MVNVDNDLGDRMDSYICVGEFRCMSLIIPAIKDIGDYSNWYKKPVSVKELWRLLRKSERC